MGISTTEGAPVMGGTDGYMPPGSSGTAAKPNQDIYALGEIILNPLGTILRAPGGSIHKWVKNKQDPRFQKLCQLGQQMKARRFFNMGPVLNALLGLQPGGNRRQKVRRAKDRPDRKSKRHDPLRKRDRNPRKKREKKPSKNRANPSKKNKKSRKKASRSTHRKRDKATENSQQSQRDDSDEPAPKPKKAKRGVKHFYKRNKKFVLIMVISVAVALLLTGILSYYCCCKSSGPMPPTGPFAPPPSPPQTSFPPPPLDPREQYRRGFQEFRRAKRRRSRGRSAIMRF